MEEQKKYIQALIKLHRGLERQGPGDKDLSNQIISQITELLPPNPRIADIGCGAGAGALLLADKFRTKIRAVDFSQEFLTELEKRAKQQGLENFIETIKCDMRSLDWEHGSIDLLWSEGAAYIITFEGALRKWRPLMATNGIAVISEMSYFTNKRPESVLTYMNNAYPDIKTESENSEIIRSSGFELLEIHRLSSKAWWVNYYEPLRENIISLKGSKDSVMQTVINETEMEMKFFEKYENFYGYSFYIIKAA
ncbi:class I SAM-dependent methyltransferase [Candidatus Parcubacteria bacterium]|nr:class I SAM-dependent methyltransferase [Candidatus Parcubacteria bacterium]